MRAFIWSAPSLCAQPIHERSKPIGASVSMTQVNSLAFLSSTLLFLGYPEQSADAAEKAESRARQIGRSFTIALTLGNIVVLGTIGGEASGLLPMLTKRYHSASTMNFQVSRDDHVFSEEPC